jgi:DNA-binding transcriptional ArsR family regulator
MKKTIIIKALSEKTRFTVIDMLMNKKNGMYVSEIIKKLKIEPTLLSHHLSELKDAKLITAKREGKSILYRINKKIAEEQKIIINKNWELIKT